MRRCGPRPGLMAGWCSGDGGGGGNGLAPLNVSEQIPGVRRRLRPQPRVPSHALAPPTFPSRFLGHAPFHFALVAPTSFAITTPSLLLPQRPLSPEHHPATNPARGPQRRATGGPRSAGRSRGAMGKDSEGDRRRYFGVERVCSPSWAARAPYNFVV